jgi:hypothetical protein
MLYDLNCENVRIEPHAIRWGHPTFSGKGPQPLLCGDSRAPRVKITISGIPNRLNYCLIFAVYLLFTNVTSEGITQPGGPGVGHPRYK